MADRFPTSLATSLATCLFLLLPALIPTATGADADFAIEAVGPLVIIEGRTPVIVGEATAYPARR